jgi:hypothetical protein
MARFPTFTGITINLLPKARIGTILSPGARRDGHSSVIFSRTSGYPNLARVNSPELFSIADMGNIKSFAFSFHFDLIFMWDGWIVSGRVGFMEF